MFCGAGRAYDKNVVETGIDRHAAHVRRHIGQGADDDAGERVGERLGLFEICDNDVQPRDEVSGCGWADVGSAYGLSRSIRFIPFFDGVAHGAGGMGVTCALEPCGGKHANECVNERLSFNDTSRNVRRGDRLTGGFSTEKICQQSRQIERDHAVETGRFLRKGGGRHG